MSLQIAETDARTLLEDHGQIHLMRYWDELNPDQRASLLAQIASIDFALMNRLIEQWVHGEPASESFDQIEPVPTIPAPSDSDDASREAWDAGEAALRAGRVGLLLVAGGQGTRLGFDGPKGSYPIGPISKKSLFEFHAEKIRNLQRRYACTLPWYIMVSEANGAATEEFFRANQYFGLSAENIKFFTQRMVPCVDESGKFFLDEPGHIAMNPNGHGGVIPATVENGIVADCKERGVDTLSYFQVDNWAVRVADPCFIGHHVMRDGEMSSKVHRKNEVREAVGVHCLCDGQYRVIEYTALDIYPQLLETNPDGSPRYYAGNPAIHIINTDFIQRVYDDYDQFPWWRAHKKITHLDASGSLVKPEEPNGYKFETFVFDALRFISHAPIALELKRLGEYTPIKQFEGKNSVQAAWAAMGEFWGQWLEAAGADVPRGDGGEVVVPIEISPEFALYKQEFLEKCGDIELDAASGIGIAADGSRI